MSFDVMDGSIKLSLQGYYDQSLPISPWRWLKRTKGHSAFGRLVLHLAVRRARCSSFSFEFGRPANRLGHSDGIHSARSMLPPCQVRKSFLEFALRFYLIFSWRRSCECSYRTTA